MATVALRSLLVLLALSLFLTVGSAGAKNAEIAPLHLVKERLLQPYVGPLDCLDEDDWHSRTWQGSLSGTFATTENYCNEIYEGQYFDGGGESVGIDIYATGRLDGLSISGYDKWGTFYERIEAVLVYSTVIGKGRNARVWNEYEACVSIRSPGYTGWPFAGMWSIEVTGDFYDSTITEESSMFPAIEDHFCPPGQGP